MEGGHNGAGELLEPSLGQRRDAGILEGLMVVPNTQINKRVGGKLHVHFTPDTQGAKGGLVAADVLPRLGLPQHDMQVLPVAELVGPLLRGGYQGDVGNLCRAWQHVERAGMELVVELCPKRVQIQLCERRVQGLVL